MPVGLSTASVRAPQGCVSPRRWPHSRMGKKLIRLIFLTDLRTRQAAKIC